MIVTSFSSKCPPGPVEDASPPVYSRALLVRIAAARQAGAKGDPVVCVTPALSPELGRSYILDVKCLTVTDFWRGGVGLMVT